MEQVELLRHVVKTLEDHGIVYYLVGSLASAVYGEPRMTQDIDIVVELQRDQVALFSQSFPSPDFYTSEPAIYDAILRAGQFNVIHPASGNKVDFIISRRDAWGRSQIDRRRREWILPDQLGYTASPEDTILGKLLYYHEGGSDKHLRDIASMLRISGDDFDRNYIDVWAQQLGLVIEWQAVLEHLRDHE